MKLNQFVNLLAILSGVSLSAVGCANSKQGVTHLPDRPATQVAGDDHGNKLGTDSGTGTGLDEANMVQPDPGKYARRDEKMFEAYKVQFDYDSPAVKGSEKPKVAQVADFLKANPANGVEVNGHCDERGTDQYNFSLGERRALAVREELIRLGVESDRILTASFGRTRPIDSEHTETARAKNRRDQFVLLSH